MYNQEIKEQFLKEYTTGGKERSGCRAMFETMSSYEYSLGKDIAEMTIDEVSGATRMTVTGTYKTAVEVQSRIKAYVKWCIKNHAFDGVNLSLQDIKVDDVDSSTYLSKTIFRSEEELIFELQTVRKFDEGFTEGLILLFAWLGIEQKDVLSIKTNDVNLDEKTINFRKRNKIIKFSDEIADVLRVYENTKIGSRPAGGDSRPVFRDDSYYTYIRKYCPKGQLGAKPLNPAGIRKSINDINQLYVAQGKESRLRNGNVASSGALYRLWILEESGIDVFAEDSGVAVAEAFGIEDELRRILWLYKNYKRAFSL